jgi:hypothetical protein
MGSGRRKLALVVAIVLTLAVGVAAGIAAWRPRGPIAHFHTRADDSRGRAYWEPHFLDDETLALLHSQGGLAISVELWSVETSAKIVATKLEHVLLETQSSGSFWLGDTILLRHGEDRHEAALDLWSPRTGRVARTLKRGHGLDELPFIELSPSGDLVASVFSGSVEVRSTATGALARSFALPDGATIDGLLFSPGGQFLAAVDLRQLLRRVYVFSLETGTLAGTVEYVPSAYPEFTRAGELLIEGDGGRTLSVFTAEGKLQKLVVVDSRSESRAPGTFWFLRNDNRLGERFPGLLLAPSLDVVWGAGVFDVSAGRIVARIAFDPLLEERGAPTLALSPSGERLALVYRTGDVFVYDVPP